VVNSDYYRSVIRMFECMVCFEESNDPYEDAVGHMATHTESICCLCVGIGNIRVCPICRARLVPTFYGEPSCIFDQTVAVTLTDDGYGVELAGFNVGQPVDNEPWIVTGDEWLETNDTEPWTEPVVANFAVTNI